MALKVNMNPSQGSPGAKLEIKVVQESTNENADYIRLAVVGEPYSRNIPPDEDGQEGVYRLSTTVPYEAWSGTYRLRFTAVGGDEDGKSTEQEFKVT